MPPLPEPPIILDGGFPMNGSLPNVLGGESDSNHTILSTQKCPFRSEKYFFTFFSQKWVILRGAPRFEEVIPCENNCGES